MEADVIICWNHGGVPKGLVESSFQRPTRVISLPNPASWAKAVEKYWPFPVRGIIKEFAPDVTPLRVAALGFSASCQGVAQLLASQDGAALDAVVAIDGIHTGYVPAEGKKSVNPNGMKPWFEYGKYAVVNERLFCITHSSVVPPNYASTTETAEYLWNTLTFEPMAFTVPELPPLNPPPTTVKVPAGPATGPARTVEYPSPPWKGKRRCGGLVVLGCSNLDVPRGTADHIYQAKTMLPLVLTALLAARWNAIDPKAPGQACFVSGPDVPFGWLTLGSAQDVKKDASKCAGSKVLPASFITTNISQKLPSATPPTSGSSLSSSSQRSLLTSAIFIALGTAGLWWLASKQQMGLLRNPYVTKSGTYWRREVLDTMQRWVEERGESYDKTTQNVLMKRLDRLVLLTRRLQDIAGPRKMGPHPAPFAADDAAALIIWPKQQAARIARSLFGAGRGFELYEDLNINMDWFYRPLD